ncbi:heavy metal translocating P-type ATPase [Candidatus Neptunochlamydia vexilliferae]|uniref:Cadmium/zinc-transporting ATPase HMA1, chloroplastic n=1 Tax=Candidatus Neptunichlamydia vexilliferae TaxID=1651774 RepID=A0ABS0AXT2_9BACT|nr:heavy metal translocating P-type ATPase [Candidatus Neptunochlamydia vexilliferae]MBF5058939.1 putative cadmium/zinc-transporting ATPase HMA1, chloroplastic [Candidatus Neptunochlamydia vexilliferae]
MPYIFDEFFTSGQEESISPFLKKNSRCWAHNLSLKSSLLSAFFLLSAFIASFYRIDLSNLCLLFVYFLAGTPALLGTIEDIKNLEINIDVLMTLAAFLSFMIGSQMEGGLLLVLFAFSGAMEESVSKKAKGALISLNHLSPTTGMVIGAAGALVERSVREINVGDHLLVRAGEVVPLDGNVIDGSSFVNLVHLTGESAPVSKKKGDEVQAGSRNLDGTLTIEVTKTSAESTLSKIIKLINEAQGMKPKLQRFLDKFGKRYALTIIALFFFFALTLPLILSVPFLGVEGSVYRALTFLIAASPCALIIATPTAYLSAISACARKGVLLKGGVTLDAFAACRIVAFDKTGTLTTGELTCTGVEPLGATPILTEEALALASALERHVTHPMAQAICQFADKKKVAPATLSNFQSVPGFGLQAVTEKGETVKIGNEAFISPEKPLDKKEMVTFLKVGEALFRFSFSDALRPQAKETLEALREEGLEVAMLTGDHEESAHKVAKELGIAQVYADLRPEHKLETISKLSAEKHLAMVGDGINDAPALTRASVGISMGKIGSATAVDASDIVLLQDDLTLALWLHRKAKKTLRIVQENLTLALGVICLATTPALLGLIPLWLAVILHEGGTVLVGLNSLRLLKNR